MKRELAGIVKGPMGCIYRIGLDRARGGIHITGMKRTLGHLPLRNPNELRFIAKRIREENKDAEMNIFLARTPLKPK